MAGALRLVHAGERPAFLNAQTADVRAQVAPGWGGDAVVGDHRLRTSPPGQTGRASPQIRNPRVVESPAAVVITGRISHIQYIGI